MNVLSLFDGMSCGQIALNRCEIKYDNYYASEIDKHAIKVTQHHYPNTIQLGSVVDVRTKNLPKIDLLIGGSPCQGFSVAGKKLNFNDPRSKLLFEYVRILSELKAMNPSIKFLLENVKMKKEHEVVINKLLNVRPLRFNSSWVSAQNRERLYWTNLSINTIPKDKKIFLSDIIEDGEVDRHKSYCIDAHYYNGGDDKSYYEKRRRQIVNLPQSSRGDGGKGPLSKSDGKAYCVDTNNGQAIEYNRNKRKLTVNECCRLQTVPDDYFKGIVSNTQAYKMLGNGWTVDIICHIFNHLQTQNKGE